MNNRPRIKLRLTAADKVLEFMGWCVVLLLWYAVTVHYSKLPEIVPVHYNAEGKVDKFGPKSVLLMIPFITTVLYVAMTIINRFPHLFNYPVKITEENALQQYTSASRLIRYLKFIVVVIFGIIAFKSIPNVAATSEGLGTWFLPFVLLSVFVPVIYFLIKSVKTA
ncbi:DUF1648 domain-containing protein [Sphingobacterium paramultivorum]|uniref:DUF1648 domain-containing protein n=1 Tax=Sphingobacterium paramultivorum TaxID=2886510 RepID=A0A7G5E603_9SPHI|nr:MULTISPECIES: DUF1648 domain-containing protein [Sphingobacterium]QMV69428.1 DUF1648 domain-containing protein [Sphingobacterium paramultivorum]WSO13230.1 DUF1648 domain-containing protein [Sphingobacterium paramultivorum]